MLHFSNPIQPHLFKAACVGAYLFLLSCTQPTQEHTQYSQPYLNFPQPISSTTPYDVDTALETKLMAENKVDDVQRMFDILAWQMFISVNWPTDAKGTPTPRITDNGIPIWESWKESFEIFKPDGSAPTPWGSPQDIPAHIQVKMDKKARILFRTNKFAEFMAADTANEIDQAFTKPIWDQNGNIVRYEIRMNREITDYITQNELYNLNGQAAFSKKGQQVSFPVGSRNKTGVMEIKVAWKILDPKTDIAERYYTTDAYVLNPDQTYSLKKVGLIGMHISTKTESSPQWIWATFEHVDNLETNPLTNFHGKPLRPSFYDPACAICPVNKFPDTNAHPIRNQIQRVLPIPMATQELNQSVQKMLAKEKSFWQYYQLIGTQWPTDPKAPPYPTPNTVYTLPEAVTNKSGGKPVPVYLTNMIMETYFQGGTSTTTLDSLNAYLGNEPAYFQIQGFPRNDPKNTQKLIFGTESCVSCHYSSTIAIDVVPKKNGKGDSAIFGKPGAADFEWLMQLKAQFKTK